MYLDTHASFRIPFLKGIFPWLISKFDSPALRPDLKASLRNTTFRMFKQNHLKSVDFIKKTWRQVRSHDHSEQPDKARPAEGSGIYSSLTQSARLQGAVDMPELSTISPTGYTTTLLCVLLLLQRGSMEVQSKEKFTTKFLKWEGNSVILYKVLLLKCLPVVSG